jgi:hypothetical protein
LSDLTRALPDPLSSSREAVSRKDANTAEITLVWEAEK